MSKIGCATMKKPYMKFAAILIILFGLSLALDRVVQLNILPNRIPVAGFLYAANTSAHIKTTEFEFTTRINNLGFRGDDVTLSYQGGCRVIALGDSFTYGT